MDLKIIASEINEIISKKQKELELSFVEDTHTYFMKDFLTGELRSDYLSVSSVLHEFYNEFDKEGKSLSMSRGNVDKQLILLKEWTDKGDYATNMGSRVHYLLEKFLVSLYGNYKDVRQPIFECDETQISKGDAMYLAGQNYIDLMHQRNCVLLDTEIVLGSNTLKYVGQPDKGWIAEKNGEVGFLITDWKTNKRENFYKSFDNMLAPFENYPNNALYHYYIQIPLYARLIKDMLKGSKYENIKFFGGVIVLLKDDATFEEYRIPKEFITKTFEYQFNY
jgi:hypothetical protein